MRSLRGHGSDQGLRGVVKEGWVMRRLHTHLGKLNRHSLRNGAASSYGWFSVSDLKEGKVPIDLSALFGSG